jgi:excisionase family DNA binding protein
MTLLAGTPGPVRPPRPLTVANVAHRLGCSPRTVLRLIERGRFPNAFRLERDWRVPLQDVLAYQAARGVNVANVSDLSDVAEERGAAVAVGSARGAE